MFIVTILTFSKWAIGIIGGIVVLAKVWNKIRPVIIVKSDSGAEFYFGISHSAKRKNMKPLTQDGIDGFEVDEDTYYGLCNKPKEILAEIGSVTPEKSGELLGSLPEKKKQKIEKRTK